MEQSLYLPLLPFQPAGTTLWTVSGTPVNSLPLEPLQLLSKWIFVQMVVSAETALSTS